MTPRPGKWIANGLAIAVIAAGAAWTLAQFTGAKRVAYRGDRHYGIALQFQSLDVSVAGVTAEKVRQQGCEGLILSETPVPFRGMPYHGEITRDPWFRLTRVRAYTDDPTRPLPPRVIQPDGSTIHTSYCVQGWRLGIPYWPIVLSGSVVSAWRAVRWVRGAIVERRRWALARFGYCAGCGYDLRATPHRCPECGTPRADATVAAAATI